jgi:hypothetical protein
LIIVTRPPRVIVTDDGLTLPLAPMVMVAVSPAPLGGGVPGEGVVGESLPPQAIAEVTMMTAAPSLIQVAFFMRAAPSQVNVIGA